ncbi:saccharopine dehydrogenase [Lactobacillus delbrueckii]|uniref:Saccharopine dehydrogenase n=1 Tax=Lactobacillus delbrueckii TaxID=1584 RepID=A0ABD0AD11_9LACO|nr:hypothetical protein HMPREF9264_0664 [Lactobacillus delbrueckii subsp. bulgaricus PB2003/044-T3-4]GHN17814.1 saccharopine dehydrogenase [Lactobacillus delbrueckii]GHN32959.1 saccharopine dehydrogenase [Lactobacillus delbrueckii]GHN42498.1 saccharopine dehydrogenase [Lactobacillus delbrueckii]
MKLLILAANGQIARIVEERILTEDKFKDIDLVLLLRRASHLQSLKDRYPDRVTLVDGDINNKQVVVDAAKGCDMIFSAVVDHDDAGNNRPTKNIIAAAEANKISRVIETSLLGIYDEVPGKFGKWNRDFCFGGNPEGSSPVNADQLLEDSGEDSGLDYTTLRLPWLNNRPEAKYSITHRHDTYVDVSGSRQSMADVVLKIMADPTFGSRDSLGIADPDTDGLTRPVYFKKNRPAQPAQCLNLMTLSVLNHHFLHYSIPYPITFSSTSLMTSSEMSVTAMR